MLCGKTSSANSEWPAANERLFAGSIQIDGTIDRFISDGRQVKASFSLHVDGQGRYLLIGEQFDATGQAVARTETGCDGSNVFEVVYCRRVWKDGTLSFISDLSWADPKMAGAHIYPVPFPVLTSELIRFAWSTFCAPRFYRPFEGTAFWLPDPQRFKTAHCYRVADRGDFVEAHEGAVREFQFDPALKQQAARKVLAVQHEGLRDTDEPWVAEGAVTQESHLWEARLKIEKSAELLAFVFPIRVLGETMNRIFEISGASRRELGSTYQLYVTNCTASDAAVALPTNPGTLQVYDFRRSFISSDRLLSRVSYKLKDRVVINSKTDVELDRLLTEQIETCVAIRHCRF